MKRLNWIAVVLMAVLLLFGGYVGAYFAVSEYTPLTPCPLIAPNPVPPLTAAAVGCGDRTFSSEAIYEIYQPMLKIESWVRGFPVSGSWDGEPQPPVPPPPLILPPDDPNKSNNPYID